MSDFFDFLFSKKMILIVLVILAVAVGLVFWDMKFMEYCSGSIDIDMEAGFVNLFAWFGVGALVTMIFAVLVICNVLFWMLPCLFKALLCLLGAIPVVNLIFNSSLRAELSESFNEWVTPKTVVYFSPFSLFPLDFAEEYESGCFIGFMISTVFAFIGGILGCAGNLLAAVGIPLLCPLLTVLAMGSVFLITESPVWLMVIGTVCFLIVGFVLIGIPVIALVRKKY